MMTKKPKRVRTLPENPLSPFHIEAELCPVGLSVTVAGVRAILSFCDEAVILSTVRGRLSVRGKRLSLLTLEGRTVEIRGTVFGVDFVV